MRLAIAGFLCGPDRFLGRSADLMRGDFTIEVLRIMIPVILLLLGMWLLFG